MNENLAKARDNFIEGIGHLASTAGLSRVIGQLYAMLFLSNEPLCLDDMGERLKISKGNASVNIRELEKLGVVKKVWVKGSRKDFYEAELNLEKLIKNGIVAAARRRMDMILETVDTTENLVKKTKGMNGEEERTAELYLKRLQNVKEIHRFAQETLENLFGSE
jgi:DNA-binding transcriptional regulator GbsR (MarR family)